MEENAPSSSANICRICMTENAATRSLFTNLRDEERTLSDVFTFVTNIHVKPQDSFSKQICIDCELCLHQLDKFKRRCIENEAKLQGIVLDPSFAHTSIKSEVCYRPYQCSLCYQQYSDVVDLQSHVISSHDQKETNNVDVSLERIRKTSNHIKEEVTDCSQYLEDSFADNEEYGNSLQCQVEVKVDTEHCEPKNEKSVETKYKCNLCNTKYKNQHSYRKHIRNIHEKRIAVPDENKLDSTCPKLTKYEAKLQKVTKFKCDLCCTFYKNQKSYRKHIRTKHEDSTTANQLKSVKFDKHQCSHCMRKFVKKSTLILHLKRHETKNSHVCTLCKREFIHKAHLDNHVLSIHTTQDGHQCDLCEASFPTEESLKVHHTSHSSQKKHQCPVCSKSFHMLSTLKDHERVHTGERPYLCPTCGKGFTQNTNLQEHLRRHAGIKPYNCEICPRRFVAKGELAAHMRKHSGAHPFVCVQCGGRFTTSSSLVKHRRTHSGERPYACDLCHMRFAASGTLKNHRRTHTGEKPYKCTHCDKAFVQKNDLVSHTRCHTGERPYVCPACGQAFRQSSALKTHLKMHPHLPTV